MAASRIVNYGPLHFEGAKALWREALSTMLSSTTPSLTRVFANSIFLARRRRAWRKTKKRMQHAHPLSSSPDLVAAPVESVVASGRVVLLAHVLCVKVS
jgi:hypothetical protein